MEGVSVRAATSGDKMAVLTIRSSVYGGLDFLPAYYDFFLKSPHIFPFVAEVDGDIEGFVAACIVDGGETLVDRAGRVSPALQGKGLYKVMLQEVLKHLSDVRKLKRKAISALQNNGKIYSPSFLQTHSLLLTRSIYTYSVDPEQAKFQHMAISSPNTIPYLDSGGVKSLLSSLNGDSVAYLFPSGRIVVDWVPYRVSNNHISFMKALDTVFASDVHEEFGKARGLLSVATTHPLQHIGNLCNIDVYGNDTSSLASHLFTHIKRVLQVSSVKTFFFIFTEHKVCHVDRAMQQLGVERDSLTSLRDGTGAAIQYEQQRVYETRVWKWKSSD